jgi:ATP-dependent Clp protease ATP-binding subunit ClpA
MTEVTTVYDRFTELTKRAIVGARDAATALGHDFTGTEHLLLGLAQTAGVASEALRAHGVELGQLRDEMVRAMAADGISATRGQAAKDALSSLGIDLAEIRRRADENFGPDALKYPRPAFSLQAKKAVQASLRQAIELGQQRIDTEHLLLGVLAEGDGVAVRVLGTLGVDAEALRRSVIERASH